MHVETIDYGNIPGCTYCHPEIASVGLTENKLKKKDTKLKLVNSHFQHLVKLPANGNTDGFIKVILMQNTENG